MHIRTMFRCSGKLTLIMWTLCLLVSSADAQTTFDLGETLIGSQKLRRVSRYPDYVKPGERAVVQRSIFQIAEDAQLIQIAFVIDGTSSMGRDIQGLKRSLSTFIANVRNRSAGRNSNRKPPVEVALVIYRDLQSPSGAFQIPSLQNNSRGFQVVTDSILENFQASNVFKTLDGVRTEDGFPYFAEQVDRGLHAALTKLKWDINNSGVARAIVVAGDAPPWHEDFLDISLNTKAHQLDQIAVPMRGYRTRELTDLANLKKIKIFSILCSSGFVGKKDPTLLKTAENARPELIRFFKTLSETTGGRFLNTSDSETVNALQEDIGGKTRRFLELKHLTSEDVEKRKFHQRHIKAAFLPLLPAAEMTFSNHPAVDRAAGMIVRLDQTEGLEIVRLRHVRRAWNTLQYEKDSEIPIMQLLAQKLRVDFLIGGDFQAQNGENVEVTLKIFDSRGQLVATANPASGTGERLEQQCLRNLLRSMSSLGRSGNTQGASFAAILGTRKSLNSLQRSLAKTDRAFQLLIQGYQLLESATEYDANHPEGKRLSQSAKDRLLKAREADPGNPFTLSLLASCEFNLENQPAAKDYLTQAYEARNRLTEDENLKLEIEADYTLFVEENPGKAIEFYERLIEGADSDFSRAALHARWMLSGLYLGDWGTTDSKIKALFPDTTLKQRDVARRNKAQKMILDILAYWPSSAEAAYYAKSIDPVRKKQPENPSKTDTRIQYATQGLLRLRRDYTYGLSVPQTGRRKVARNSSNPTLKLDGS